MINNKSSEFDSIASLITLSDCLLGGTRYMRAAETAYLPQMAQETQESYDKRLGVSVLYPAYAETVRQMNGRVFFKEINKENVTISKNIIDDFDANGNDLDAVMSESFKDGLAYGRAYALISAPDGSEAKTKADEKALNIRPYAVLIHPSQVLGVKRHRGEITEFRYATSELITDEEYKESTLKKVIVHQVGVVKVYTEINGEYVLSEQYEVMASNKPLPVVPVAELILENNTLPLEHLAYLNIKHWQSQSDQDNILKYARVPMLKTIGLEGSEVIQVGGVATNLPEGANMEWVEHSGAAIGAGQISLDKLEDQMQAAGAKLLTRTKLSMTDSQASEEQNKEISTLRYYANLLEDFTEKLLYFVSLFEGGKDGGHVEISGNIDADFNQGESLERIFTGVKLGVVSSQTAFNEMQRRGVINSEIEWNDEQERLSGDEESII